MCSLRSFYLGIIVAVISTGCGPTTITQTRMEWKSYNERESKQEKDGVIAELQFVQKVPGSFVARVQACDQSGRLVADRNGNPHFEPVSFRRPGQHWQLMALTNQTQHVIRLNQVAIRAFDPAGNQNEPLTKEDLYARLLSDRPCGSSHQAINQFRVIKIFDRNMEIVPGTTATFWIAFAPASAQMSGVWKFAIYEVPVKVNEAGFPTRTTRFEMRVIGTQFVDTYTREPFGKPILVESKEVEAVEREITTGSPGTPTRSPEPLEREIKRQEPAIRRPTPPALPAPLSRDTISRVQSQLKALGFDPGPADGVIGPKTRDALRRFQNARSLSTTGDPDAGTLDALGIKSESVIKY